MQALFYTIAAVWITLSIGLLLKLKVFRGSALWNAPPRTSSFTPLIAGAVFLLYMGAQVAALVAISGGLQASPSAAATAATSAAGVAAGKPSADVVNMVRSSGAMALGGLFVVVCVGVMVPSMVAGGLKKWLLGDRHWLEALGWGVVGWFIIFPWLNVVSQLMEWLLNKFGQHLTPHPTLKALHETMPVPYQLVLIITAGVFAPVVEELVFRGVLQTSLVQRGWGFFRYPSTPPAPPPPAAAAPDPSETLSYAQGVGVYDRNAWRSSAFQRWCAIILSSVFFTVIHGMPNQFPVLFLLSVAIGYVYERTGSLLAAISLHAVFNCVTLALTLYVRDLP